MGVDVIVTNIVPHKKKIQQYIVLIEIYLETMGFDGLIVETSNRRYLCY